ncbi:MAG TPA: bifunctional acetate--CoA ligase family protein/GNAT family N-acetyltransferase [Ignavibacteria bacterium]|nr:bifunctional acetate--CoA ligase family protein/GNAT family N-acetyltransferase [Ignavibacteria bacterium]
MSGLKLDSFFNPRRIALIGVSINPNSVSGKVLTNLVGSGFKGVVYPINPSSEAVMGIPCYPDLRSLPKVPDLAIICTAASQVPSTIDECGKTGIKNIIVISAGFKEAGETGKKLENEIKSCLKKYSGMRILGPNCLGMIVPGINLNASFSAGMPKTGNIAFISQSGALCTSVLDWAIEKKIGFSYFVSIGNAIDIDYSDLIDFIGEDDKTKSIILYIESVTQARKFMTAARSFARSKPIVAYKAGRFPESAKVAASHTGAMAAEDAIYDAAFRRMGVARVFDIGDIFDVVELISRNKIPKGPRLGIVTNAGGPGVMATDALIAENGMLAELSEETFSKLNASLPEYWSKGNPVDVLGDANSKRIGKAVQIMIEDKEIDAVLVILTPQAMTNPTATALELTKISADNKKPLLAAYLGGEKMREGVRILNDNGVPVYSTPEQAVRAFMSLVAYSRNLVTLYETPEDINVNFSPDRMKLRRSFDKLIPETTNILSEDLSKSVLETYGIMTAKPRKAKTADDAVRLADKMGYPVVIKIDSDDITHKTDVGGVVLNIEDSDLLKLSYNRMMNVVKEKMPSARINGVTVQPMIKQKDSVEMILGIKKDETFGTVILAGMGGTGAELFKDRSIGFPPLNESLAYRMLESLKIFPLLKGYRGSTPANIDKLVETLIRLSYLAADYPEITELDINPLLVSASGTVALDARVVVDKSIKPDTAKAYSHLAIRPYPEELVKKIELQDGTNVMFRPIKPEDEPMWIDMLASCSKESIYSRFRYFFQWASHEVAARYCYIDYDREIAIVAELGEGDSKKLIGVGRLIADPDHETVEYAILITDAWQNKDLGGMLTDYCFEIAKKWGLKKIVAQTTSDNKRMISVFEKRGFSVEVDPRSSLVEVVKSLE